MALTRFNGNVVPFASESTTDNRTVFGDTVQADDIDSNLNADFKKGWEIVGLNDNPTKQDFNAMGYTLGALTSYLYQMGIAEYNVLQEYKLNGLCIGSDGTIYQSLVDANIGNALNDVSKWKNINNSFVDLVNNQSIDGIKTFVKSPISTATQSTNANALTKYSAVVKNSGDETIAGIKTFSSSPIVPTPTTGTQAVNKEYVDLKISTNQIFDKPNKGALFIKVSPSSIKIPIGFKVGVGAESFKLSTDYTLSLATNLIIPETKTAGTDYYVYATSTGTFYISSNENISIDRLIGGFHYGLTGETEAPTGNKTEDDMVKIRGINQYSFWDLKYRPVASTNGMVNIGKRWYDIYLLNSEHITNGTSKAGLFIAAGATTNGRDIPKIPLEYGGNGTITYGKFTWFQACEIGKAHSKELISYAEFPTITYGVNEQKSSQTNAYETVVGKIEHYPNLTSKYGIEQATGVQEIWGSDVQGIGGDGWKTGLTDGRGDIYAYANQPTAVVLGGRRVDGVIAGSRASAWSNYVWNSSWHVGCRFACDHLELE